MSQGIQDTLPVNSGFRRDVQGLRAVAVVAVILYHARDLLPGGYVGVDVFFVISGFVITRSLLNEHGRRGRISLSNFYRRRVRRLTPMLTVAVVTTVVFSALLAPLAALRKTALTGIAASLLAANVYLDRGIGYFAEAAELNPLLHTWSLSLEEQFYLVFPPVLLGLLALRWGGSGSRVRLGLIAFSILSFSLSIALSSGVFGDWIGPARGTRLAFFMMPTRAWQFGVGAVLATFPESRFGNRRASAVRGILGLVLLALAVALIDDQFVYPGYWALLPTVATALLLMAPTGPTAQVLSGRGMVRMGDVSYSWYLWHWPFIVFTYATGVDHPVALAAAGLASYVLSAWTYENVEDRFRHSRSRQAGPDSWLAVTAASVVTVAIASAALLAFAARGLPDSVDLASMSGEPHADRTCDRTPLSPGIVGCRFGNGAGRLLLIGDSNAGHFTEAVVLAGEELGYRVEVVTESACPLLPLEVFNEGERDGRCADRSQAVHDWLISDPPDVLIHASAADIHVAIEGRSLARGEFSGADAYSDALHALVGPLAELGTPVVAVLPIPKFSLEPGAVIGAERCSVLSMATMPLRCAVSIGRSDAQRQREAGVRAMQASLRSTHAVLLDPFDAVCPGDPCLELAEGFWRYRDARHISVPMATNLRSHLIEAVAEAVATAPAASP